MNSSLLHNRCLSLRPKLFSLRYSLCRRPRLKPFSLQLPLVSRQSRRSNSATTAVPNYPSAPDFVRIVEQSSLSFEKAGSKILRAAQNLSFPRRTLWRISPTRHNRSSGRPKPEEAAHSGNVRPWKYDFAVHLSNFSLRFVKVTYQDIIQTGRSLMGASRPDSYPTTAD